MVPESLLPNSHVSATFPYSEPAHSSPFPTSHVLKIHLNIILPSGHGFLQWSLPLRLDTQSRVPPNKTVIDATVVVYLKGQQWPTLI
jgi:hypothetical protein